MPAISNRRGRIEEGIFAARDFNTGKKTIILEVDESGFRVLNPDSAMDYTPKNTFIGGNTQVPCLKLRVGGKKETWFPVKNSLSP